MPPDNEVFSIFTLGTLLGTDGEVQTSWVILYKFIMLDQIG